MLILGSFSPKNKALMKKHEGYINDLREWLVLRNYSAATVSAYSTALGKFLAWRSSAGLGVTFAQEDARRYLLHRYYQGRRWQTINGDYSAMQKFFVHILGLEWKVDHLPRPRKERSLPAVLSLQEVERLIIDMILQHVVPEHFRRIRKYGLHYAS